MQNVDSNKIFLEENNYSNGRLPVFKFDYTNLSIYDLIRE